MLVNSSKRAKTGREKEREREVSISEKTLQSPVNGKTAINGGYMIDRLQIDLKALII